MNSLSELNALPPGWLVLISTGSIVWKRELGVSVKVWPSHEEEPEDFIIGNNLKEALHTALGLYEQQRTPNPDS